MSHHSNGSHGSSSSGSSSHYHSCEEKYIEHPCDDGKIFDFEICGCKETCIEQHCPEGQIFDFETCCCVDTCIEQICDFAKIFDFEICGCKCIEEGPCEFENYVRDPNTCACECQVPICDLAAGEEFFPDFCVCGSNFNRCNRFQTYSPRGDTC